jgi:membrane-associated phospholipid phosphatase
VVLGKEMLQVVDGIPLHSWRSFPSGHTATAFSLLFALAIPYSGKIQIFIAILALMIGYSRIYLNQHFGLDVAVGASIGVASGYLAYLIVRPGLERPKPLAIKE